MTFAKELIQSAHEALQIANGQLDPARSFTPDVIDVAAIRKRLHLSQAAFAARYGLLPATIRDWEQGRRSPDRAATVLLTVIDRDPEAVARVIARETGSNA